MYKDFFDIMELTKKESKIMPDMIVKLYSLPKINYEKIEELGATIRRPLASEKTKVLDWIQKNFSCSWADECGVTFSFQPISTYIAVIEKKIVGFASYDAACRNFFGPTGVKKEFQGKGIGKVLLLKSLASMKEQGYAYGIIGGVGPEIFYTKTVGAVTIEGSDSGIYEPTLK